MPSTSPQAADDLGAAWSSQGPLSLFSRLARTSLFLEALQAECLEPFGIGFSDYAVLRVLSSADPPHRLSPSRLADAVVCTTGGMTKIIDRLERAGLVQRTPDPNDRRGVLVSLTEEGITTSGAASDAYRVGRERVLARLDTHEAVAVDEALGRLLDVFEADRQERP